MALSLNKQIIFCVGILLLFSAVNVAAYTHGNLESTSTTTSEPEMVRKCYRCEGDCHESIGKVEECHPNTDMFKFACYKLIVNGKTFQRGCTRDFSQGEECVEEEENKKYCFCRTDECNHASLRSISTGLLTFAIYISMIVIQ